MPAANHAERLTASASTLKLEPNADAGPHPVIVSRPERVVRAPLVNVLLGS